VEAFAEHPEIISAREVDLEERYQTTPHLKTTGHSSDNLNIFPNVDSMDHCVCFFFNQLINQSINQSINPFIYQSINMPLYFTQISYRKAKMYE